MSGSIRLSVERKTHERYQVLIAPYEQRLIGAGLLVRVTHRIQEYSNRHGGGIGRAESSSGTADKIPSPAPDRQCGQSLIIRKSSTGPPPASLPFWRAAPLRPKMANCAAFSVADKPT